MNVFAGMNESVVEALAVREAFRRLNFTPEEIFVGPIDGVMYVQVRRGKLVFTATCGLWDADDSDFEPIWEKAAALWNSEETPNRDRLDVYENSHVRMDSVAFVQALVAKGFNVRRIDA